MASESQNAQLVMNKDSNLPKLDIEILPGIEYNGENLTLELRVIELDQDDNDRMKSIIN